jgi:Tol biopolymer transport system component
MLVKELESTSDPTIVFRSSELGRFTPFSWSTNGREIAVVSRSTDTGDDIGVIDVTTGAVRMLIATAAIDNKPQFSPDGRWLAYASNRSGRMEVYVTDSVGSSLRQQVSVDGGDDPVWSRDGRELFFVANGRMMAASLERSAALRFSKPTELFDGVETGTLYTSYSVAADGRFLMRQSPARSKPTNHVTVATNWLNEVRRLTTARNSSY